MISLEDRINYTKEREPQEQTGMMITLTECATIMDPSNGNFEHANQDHITLVKQAACDRTYQTVNICFVVVVVKNVFF